MRGVVMHSAGDVRVEEREDPKIIEPTDAVIRLTATCIWGSNLWVATSSRRRPGTRRPCCGTDRPACCGVIRARREARKSWI